MASASYAANKCSNCSRKVSDGIVRKSKFYCNNACYDAVKKVHFSDGVRPSSIVVAPSPRAVISKGIRPSSIVVAPLPPVVIKTCNYCFDTFEKHACPGIDYGRLWFCSQYHLQLANPRPASGQIANGMGHIMAPGMGHIMAPGMVHLMPVANPFFGRFGSFF
jgi:hypothetical protein